MDSAILFFGVLPSFWKITDLPFSLYSTFVIESRHGFNKYGLFFRDIIKGIFLATIMGPPIVSAIIVILISLLIMSTIYFCIVSQVKRIFLKIQKTP
ncbi:hypothetical protein UlMin_020044 [Ulmus minor]